MLADKKVCNGVEESFFGKSHLRGGGSKVDLYITLRTPKENSLEARSWRQEAAVREPWYWERKRIMSKKKRWKRVGKSYCSR